MDLLEDLGEGKAKRKLIGHPGCLLYRRSLICLILVFHVLGCESYSANQLVETLMNQDTSIIQYGRLGVVSFYRLITHPSVRTVLRKRFAEGSIDGLI